MIGDWLWCGAPHHFIGSADCRYTLATWVADGNFLVSTVGDYHPQHSGIRQTIGIGEDDFFETMVFRCNPFMVVDGEPLVTDWNELACAKYATVRAASEGHMKMCLRFDQEEQ